MNTYHSHIHGPPPFFHSDTNLGLGHVPIHSVDKTHVLAVTMELIWLLLLSIHFFNFIPTLNKSLRLTRFRKSYVSHLAVVLTNHKGYTAFLLEVCCAVQSGHIPFPFAAVFPQC